MEDKDQINPNIENSEFNSYVKKLGIKGNELLESELKDMLPHPQTKRFIELYSSEIFSGVHNRDHIGSPWVISIEWTEPEHIRLENGGESYYFGPDSQTFSTSSEFDWRFLTEVYKTEKYWKDKALVRFNLKSIKDKYNSG